MIFTIETKVVLNSGDLNALSSISRPEFGCHGRIDKLINLKLVYISLGGGYRDTFKLTKLGKTILKQYKDKQNNELSQSFPSDLSRCGGTSYGEAFGKQCRLNTGHTGNCKFNH